MCRSEKTKDIAYLLTRDASGDSRPLVTATRYRGAGATIAPLRKRLAERSRDDLRSRSSDQLADHLSMFEDGIGTAGEVIERAAGVDAEVAIDRGKQVLRAVRAVDGVFGL